MKSSSTNFETSWVFRNVVSIASLCAIAGIGYFYRYGPEFLGAGQSWLTSIEVIAASLIIGFAIRNQALWISAVVAVSVALAFYVKHTGNYELLGIEWKFERSFVSAFTGLVFGAACIRMFASIFWERQEKEPGIGSYRPEPHISEPVLLTQNVPDQIVAQVFATPTERTAPPADPPKKRHTEDLFHPASDRMRERVQPKEQAQPAVKSILHDQALPGVTRMEFEKASKEADDRTRSKIKLWFFCYLAVSFIFNALSGPILREEGGIIFVLAVSLIMLVVVYHYLKGIPEFRDKLLWQGLKKAEPQAAVPEHVSAPVRQYDKGEGAL